MKLAKYIIELVVITACGYCTYYLLSTVNTWKEDNVIFYIFAIIYCVIVSIVCICDIIESIYHSYK